MRRHPATLAIALTLAVAPLPAQQPVPATYHRRRLVHRHRRRRRSGGSRQEGAAGHGPHGRRLRGDRRRRRAGHWLVPAADGRYPARVGLSPALPTPRRARCPPLPPPLPRPLRPRSRHDLRPAAAHVGRPRSWRWSSIASRPNRAATRKLLRSATSAREPRANTWSACSPPTGDWRWCRASRERPRSCGPRSTRSGRGRDRRSPTCARTRGPTWSGPRRFRTP